MEQGWIDYPYIRFQRYHLAFTAIIIPTQQTLD